jgi:peptide/nickel transport system substrate-binding protein
LLSVLLIAVVVGIGYMTCRDLTPQPGTSVTTTPAPPAAPSRGGVLTASLRSEPRSFNRITEARYATDLYAALTQGKLVRTNRASQEVEPSLAEKWVESPDHKTFTLTLRDGLNWSDGTPLTSDDVVFTFRAMYETKPEVAMASSMQVNGKPLKVSAPDARTVVVTYPDVYGPGIRLLDNLTIVPKHKLEAAFKEGKFGLSWSPSTPVADLIGAGPFMLTAYEPGQRLVFTRNPNYWKKDAAGVQLPYLDSVVLDIVPDQNAELIRLQSGQIDMLQQEMRAEDISTVRPLVRDGKLQLLELGVGVDPDFLIFNAKDAHWAKDPRRAWITRKEFRQAISHAVDREAFANTIFLGEAVPIWGPITPGNKQWFSPNVKRYPYSVDTAKKLLASIGLTDRDGDEWLEDEKGTEARFTVITYKGNTSLERSAALLAQDLKPVGIAVDVAIIESSALIDLVMGKQDFDACYFYVTPSDLNPTMSADLWLSTGSAHFWNMGQSGPSSDWEKQIDDLMNKLSVTLDEAESRKIFNQVQDILADNLPVLYFVQKRVYMGVNSRVGNMNPSILRPQILWSAETISIKH